LQAESTGNERQHEHQEPSPRDRRLANELCAQAQQEQVSGDQRKTVHPGTPPDVTSVRAKSSRHGKTTADKWNQ
jgi:hypothetical protein